MNKLTLLNFGKSLPSLKEKVVWAINSNGHSEILYHTCH